MEAAIFPMRNFFAEEDDSDDEGTAPASEQERFSTREHAFPGMVLRIREFDFHPVNANLVWPGASSFAAWIMECPNLLQGRRILELGSGTGALAIFLHRQLGCNITTSDYDDVEIENNIAHNCSLNGMPSALPHVRHTWGDLFPLEKTPWDVIIASDILLYVKQYEKLVVTLQFLLSSCGDACVRSAPGHGIGAQETEPALSPFTRVLSSCKDEAERTPCHGQHESVDDSSQAASLQELASPLDSNNVWVDCEELGLASPGEGTSIGCSKHALESSGRSQLEGRTQELEGERSQRCPTSLPVPCFLMSWRRRIPKADEEVFFGLCRSAGLVVDDYGQRIFCIHPSEHRPY